MSIILNLGRNSFHRYGRNVNPYSYRELTQLEYTMVTIVREKVMWEIYDTLIVAKEAVRMDFK